MLPALRSISRRLKTSHSQNNGHPRGCNSDLDNRTNTTECLPRIGKFKVCQFNERHIGWNYLFPCLQLITVVNVSKPLDAAELKKYVKMRGKKKSSVKVAIRETHLEIADRANWISRFSFGNMQEVLNTDSNPRVFGFSMFTSNDDYLYHILISKKCRWFKRRNISGKDFADILRNQMIKFQDSIKEEELFGQESSLLELMDMVVPLHASEVASYSKTNSFEYTPLHVRDPSLCTIPVPEDYHLSPHLAKDVMDPSIPEYMRNGICCDKANIVTFEPENETTIEDHDDAIWFSGEVKTTLVVGCTQNNGLQHLPTVPTKGFLCCFEKLLNAYLNPKMYYNRGVGVSNDSRKIANYLLSCESDCSLRILSCRDLKRTRYWYFPPSCVSEPDFDLEVDT